MRNFTPNGIRRMYGHQTSRWIACRNKWMKPEVMKIFTNDFLRSTGLDGIFSPGAVVPVIV